MESVHEGFVNHSNKEIGTINNIIWQFPFKNTEEVINKANRYSTLGVEKLQEKGVKGSVFKAVLDGGPGLVIAFGNFEGTFYRYIKLTETQKNWKAPSIDSIQRSKKLNH